MSRTYDDDLFKESTMTFGQHLGELRDCLFKAILGLVVGVLIGLAVGKYVVQFIERPLTHALEQYFLRKSESQINEKYPGLSPELLEVVLRDQKIFEEVSIEPGILFEDLKEKFPTQFQGIPVPQFVFQARDLLSPAEFCRRLRAGGKADDKPTPSPAAKRVWDLLTDKQRSLVEEIADSAEVTAEQKTALARACNELLARPEFYQEAAFKDTGVSDDVRKQLAELKDAKSDTNVIRFNWTLLSKVFAGEIAGPHPYLVTMRLWRDIKDVQWVKPISINPTEAFMFWVKASFIAGLIISSPWVFWQIWAFVAAGLYPHERKYVYIYLPFSLLLFLAGAALTFFMVFEPVLKFLFDFNDWLGIEPSPRIADWMSFVLWMPLAFGVSFQLPLVMLFVDRIGIVDYKFFLSKWRFAVLAIFIVVAIFNPSPDPYSMMLMALPLTGLYFGGILLCLWGNQGRRRPRTA